jgi:hypothetical protein
VQTRSKREGSRVLHRLRGGSGGGNGAAGGAPIGGSARPRARECGSLGVYKGRCGGCPSGAYIGPGGEEKRLPAAMAINGHSALIAIKRGEIKEW